MKKKFSIVGIIVGVAFILVGILAMAGVFGGIPSYPKYTPAKYDLGYGTFGADYYTYSVNNTAEIANFTEATCYGVAEITKFLTAFMGVSSMLVGVIVICGFGIVLSTCKNDEVGNDSGYINDNNQQSENKSFDVPENTGFDVSVNRVV